MARRTKDPLGHVQPKTKPGYPTSWARNRAPRTAIEDARCPVQAACGSCLYINSHYQESLDEKVEAGLKQLRAHVDTHHVKLLPTASAPVAIGYRNHVKLAVRPALPESGKRFAIGLFRPDSHEVFELSGCPVQRQTINSLLDDLRIALEASSLKPYDEKLHEGDLRYLAIRSSHLTTELMLTLVLTHASHKRELRQIIVALKEKGHNLASAFMNIQAERTNTIFGSENIPLTAVESMRERLVELDFDLGPTAFFQINPSQAADIYRRIEQLAGNANEGMVAWDLYSGVGQIGLVLARAGYRTLGIEENPEAVAASHKNAERNASRANLEFLQGRVEAVLTDLPAWASQPELIVANPARSGMARGIPRLLAETLQRKPGTKLIYVSCEMRTLARDLQDFVDLGCKVLQLQAFDMFPFTEKVEWIAVVG